MSQGKIVMYGGMWCGDCRRAKRFFDSHSVRYEWVDVDEDDEARKYVVRVNNGRRTIPTIVFGDGSILVEPSDAQLAEKLGLGR